MPIQWTSRMDKVLLQLRDNGYSYAVIAERLGVSKCAAIARWHRLSGTVFEADEFRGRMGAEASRQRRKARLKKQATGKRLMARLIKRGIDRNKIVNVGRKYSCSHAIIATVLGVTPACVTQFIRRNALTG